MHPVIITLVIILVVILVFVAYLSLIPVDFSFILEKSEKLVKRVISMVWGAIGMNFIEGERLRRFEFLLFGQTIIRKEREKKPRPKMEREKVMNFVRSFPELQSYFSRLVKAFIKAVSIKIIECDVKLGFSNPSNTGLVYGYFKAFQSLLSPIKKIRMRLDPVFDREIMEGRLNASFRINYPIRVIIPVIKLFIKKPVRQFMRDMR